MRAEKNPLDLNNLPDDYTRDGSKQVVEDTSSSAAGGSRKKKSGSKDGKDESDKVYECRFCSLKFCKSQALGGHMNRHRQERETETLNRARQLVFSNDNLLSQGAHHLGGQQIPPGGYHQASNLGDPTLPFTSVYPTRLFSGSSSTILPPPLPGQQPPPSQPYMYPSPPSRTVYPSQYPPPHPINDYIVGHVYNTHQYNHPNPNYVSNTNNYTCIGAPVGAMGHGLAQGNGRTRGSDIVTQQQHLDSSMINRFQDGF